MAHLDDVYSILWSAHGGDFEELDQSLRPRSWEFLFDLAGDADLGPKSVVADVGCGRGNHCFELARRFGCHTIGIALVSASSKAR